MFGNPHAEGLVLDRMREGCDLGLEDVGRRCAIHRSPPPTVGHPGEQQLLLDAGQGDSDALVHSQWRSTEVRNQIAKCFVGEWLRTEDGRRRWSRFVIRLDAVSYTHLTLPTNREV